MNALYCCFAVIGGYLFGSVSPSYLFSKKKHENLKEKGTKNLGATNTLLVLGKGYGAAVMLLDILKGFLAVKIAELVFPGAYLAGYLAGCAAVFGHVFPFYLKFKGGKGLAAFGGFVLGVDWRIFLMLLVLGIILMVIVNYSFIMPFSAATLFPILDAIKTKDAYTIAITVVASVLIIVKHWSNAVKAKNGDDFRIRTFIKEKIFG
ncbi:MAG: glycerol-3-phosphate acyltransferase [Oscillospiraceae bacterium]|nr:glycerol-3-phosphate acyltransferase [Oscillospiraceae bacterium]